MIEALAAVYALDRDDCRLTRIDDTLEFIHDEMRDPEGRYPRRRDERQSGILPSYELIDQASVARAYLAAAGAITEHDRKQSKLRQRSPPEATDQYQVK